MDQVLKADEKLTTEEKIKEAARIVFLKKGYAATKTRDIAEQAGLNLALLNYYFRSKEKLFEIIMMEKVQQLFAAIAPVFTDKETSLNTKIDLITTRYIDLLVKNTDLPLFVLSEIRNNPESFSKAIHVDDVLLKSHFVKQLAEKKPDVNPVQLIMSLLGMLIFPFIAKPVLQAAGAVNDKMFEQLMGERKELVSKWMKLLVR
ncbi:TetR/AcrR family transcriptional regulator [Segetibacter sp. 3557_3]|nr:TetR/AcrR family transcriptional regulator [Segetibacter sp. 3557_3]